MSLFTHTSDGPQYVALLDIGSASVTGTIAYSDPDGGLEILWSTQERILLKHVKGRAETGRHIMSAFMNVILELGQSGLQAVRAEHPRSRIDTTQVSIAAPWSYTITKKIRYEKEKPFTINHALYRQLLSSMEEKVTNELKEHEVADHLGLRVVSRSLTSLTANGYLLESINGQKASSLTISLSNTVIQNYLHEMIEDAHNKVMPKSDLQIVSYVLALYYVLKDIHPEMQEYCVVNQTLEATELGIVRNGVLCYSTHEPYGIITLCRDLCDVFGVTIDEMYGIIQSDQWSTRYEKLSKEKQAKADAVLETYQETVAELMRQTGDSFTIPKSLYIHTASCTYDFFATYIEHGAALASGLAHIVHNVDEELLRSATGLEPSRSDRSCVELISAYYFHTHKDDPGLIAR